MFLRSPRVQLEVKPVVCQRLTRGSCLASLECVQYSYACGKSIVRIGVLLGGAFDSGRRNKPFEDTSYGGKQEVSLQRFMSGDEGLRVSMG